MHRLFQDLLHQINLPTALAAAALVLVVILVIKIGKALLFAAMFGAMAGGVSLGQGNSPRTAGMHAAVGFGVAAVTLFFIRMTKSLIMWLVITGVGVIALFVFDGMKR